MDTDYMVSVQNPNSLLTECVCCVFRCCKSALSSYRDAVGGCNHETLGTVTSSHSTFLYDSAHPVHSAVCASVLHGLLHTNSLWDLPTQWIQWVRHKIRL